jgi:hypothetical protein
MVQDQPLTPAAAEAQIDATFRNAWHQASDGVIRRVMRELLGGDTIDVTLQLALSGMPTTLLPPHVVHFGYRVKWWTIGCAGDGDVEIDVLYASYERYDGTVTSMLSMCGDPAQRPQVTGDHKAEGNGRTWTMRDIPMNGFVLFNVLTATVPFTIALKLERGV